MNNDRYFYELQDEYPHYDSLVEHVKTANFVYSFNQNKIDILPRLYFDDKLLRAVKEKFGGRMSVFKHWPNMFYKWHRDGDAAVHINMLLGDYNSKTLFEIEEPYPEVKNFTELKYTPGKWYLFNAQERHCVMNFDTRDRYLLSYTIRKSDTEHIQDVYGYVVDWYKNEYLKT